MYYLVQRNDNGEWLVVGQPVLSGREGGAVFSGNQTAAHAYADSLNTVSRPTMPPVDQSKPNPK